MLTKAYIPYRGYYSTPFVRWQGSLANEHSIVLGANTSRRFSSRRGGTRRRSSTSWSAAPSIRSSGSTAVPGLRG